MSVNQKQILIIYYSCRFYPSSTEPIEPGEPIKCTILLKYQLRSIALLSLSTLSHSLFSLTPLSRPSSSPHPASVAAASPVADAAVQKGGDSRVSHGGSGIGGLSDGRGGIGRVSLQATAVGGLQGDGDSLAAAMPSLSPDPMGGEAAAYTVTMGGEEACRRRAGEGR